MADQSSLARKLAMLETVLSDITVPPDFWSSRWEFLRKHDRMTLDDHLILAFFLPPIEALPSRSLQPLRRLMPVDIVALAKKAQKIARDPKELRHFSAVGPGSKEVDCVALSLLLTTFSIAQSRVPKSLIREEQALWVSIADHIGLWSLRYAIEDTIFEVLQPEDYALMQSVLKKNGKQYRSLLSEAIAIVRHHSERKKIRIQDIYAREKNLYGIYAKMRADKKGVNQIRDFFGVRIIVKSISECYAVLVLLHGLWPHYAEHVKDFIKQPKPNGYQSLHTTVSCLQRQDVEFQIRTEKMHEIAQYGQASHASYKGRKRS